ncbi:MAG: hypothetical protein K2O32_02135 [Acetatifactor sp.]|nr:hypothetical protein [Acetatifactor sp.]
MRQKVLCFLTVCIYISAMVFGIVKKQTYTDLAGQENYLSQITVAELSEDSAESQCVMMSQKLPDAAIILRVKVTGEIEHLFQVDRQKIVIQEVYEGDGLEKGEEIYLFSRHWSLSAIEEPYSIERGFVNIMEVGAEYLVFAEVVMEDWETGIPAVKVYDDFMVAPVFCYEEHQNVIIPILDGSAYVSYQDVMDNEFFVASENALKNINTLKNQMLSLYPRD